MLSLFIFRYGFPNVVRGYNLLIFVNFESNIVQTVLLGLCLPNQWLRFGTQTIVIVMSNIILVTFHLLQEFVINCPQMYANQDCICMYLYKYIGKLASNRTQVHIIRLFVGFNVSLLLSGLKIWYEIWMKMEKECLVFCVWYLVIWRRTYKCVYMPACRA